MVCETLRQFGLGLQTLQWVALLFDRSLYPMHRRKLVLCGSAVHPAAMPAVCVRSGRLFGVAFDHESRRTKTINIFCYTTLLSDRNV